MEQIVKAILALPTSSMRVYTKSHIHPFIHFINFKHFVELTHRWMHQIGDGCLSQGTLLSLLIRTTGSTSWAAAAPSVSCPSQPADIIWMQNKFKLQLSVTALIRHCERGRHCQHQQVHKLSICARWNPHPGATKWKTDPLPCLVRLLSSS